MSRSALYAPWTVHPIPSVWTKRGGIFEARPPRGFGPVKRFTTSRAAKTYLRQLKMKARKQSERLYSLLRKG